MTALFLKLSVLKRNESFKLLRFALVGGMTAVIFATMIYVFEQAGFFNVPSTVLAYSFAITFQYLGHSIFTFRSPVKDHRQMLRFLIVNFIGLIVSVACIDHISPLFGVPRTVTALVLVFFLAVSNYLAFRLWAFSLYMRSKPHGHNGL